MIYQKLIENSPNYLNAYLRKSQILQKMELYRPALELYKKAIKICPDYSKAYFDIAHCLDKLGMQREAKRYYHKFLELQPNNENANLVMKRIEKLRKPKCTNLSLV